MIRSFAAPEAELELEFNKGEIPASKEKLKDVVITAMPSVSFGDLSFSRQFVQLLKETRPSSKIKWVLVNRDARLPYMQEHRKEIELDGVELVLESYSSFSSLTKYHDEFLEANVWCGPAPLLPIATMSQLNQHYATKFFLHYDTDRYPSVTEQFLKASIPMASVYTTGVKGHGVFFDPMRDLITTSTDFSDVCALKAIGIDSSTDLATYQKENMLFHGYWARKVHKLSPMNLFSQPLFIAVCIQIMLLQGTRKNVDILVPYPLSTEEQDELAVFLKAIFPNNKGEYSLIYSEKERMAAQQENKHSPTKWIIRIHAYGDVSKRDMLMMQKVSEPFTVATGDQSAIECLDKLLIYQTMAWKQPMMEYLLSATEAEGLERLHQWFQLTSQQSSSKTLYSKDLVFQIAEFYTTHFRELLKEVERFSKTLRATKNLNKTMPEWILEEAKPRPISPARDLPSSRSISYPMVDNASPLMAFTPIMSATKNLTVTPISNDVTEFHVDEYYSPNNFPSQLYSQSLDDPPQLMDEKILPPDPIDLLSNNLASSIVSTKPLPTTSRGSSARSSNLGTSLYPAHKARDVGEVVLAETINEANNFVNFTPQLGDDDLFETLLTPLGPLNNYAEVFFQHLRDADIFEPLLTPHKPLLEVEWPGLPLVLDKKNGVSKEKGTGNVSSKKLASIPFFKPRKVPPSKEQTLFFKTVNTKLLDLKLITQKIGLLEDPVRRNTAMLKLSKLEQDKDIRYLYSILSAPSHSAHKALTDYLLGKGFTMKMLKVLVEQATTYVETIPALKEEPTYEPIPEGPLLSQKCT